MKKSVSKTIKALILLISFWAVWKEIHSIKCPSSVSLPNVQFSLFNSYNVTADAYILGVGIEGNSGAIYFGAMAGTSINYGTPTTTILSKKSPGDEGMEWVKIIYLFPFWEDGYVLTKDEERIYIIRDLSSISVQIAEFNTENGELINLYTK